MGEVYVDTEFNKFILSVSAKVVAPGDAADGAEGVPSPDTTLDSSAAEAAAVEEAAGAVGAEA